MTERLRLRALVATTAAMLLTLAGAAFTAEQAGAQKCNPTCMPPPEEEEIPPPQPKPQPPAKSMLVVNVGWESGNPSRDSPLSEGALTTYVDYLRNHLNEWFASSAAPAEEFKRWTVFSGGSYRVAPPVMPPSPNPCTSVDQASFFRSLADSAEAKARAQGFNPGAYTVFVVVWSRGVCNLSGMKVENRIGLSRPAAAPHEFGHHLGLGHPFGLRCWNASRELVPLSGDCEPQPYNDSYDAMGANVPDTSYSAIPTNKLGWLRGQFFDVTMADFTGTWTIKPFTEPAHRERALRLKDGETTLWLEYRTELGIDHAAFSGHRFFPEPGLVIHRELPGNVSQLLDMTPGSRTDREGNVSDTVDFEDARLPVGQTWANPLGEAKITLNGQSATGATVTISSRRVTVPNLLGLTPMQADTAITAAGLRPNGFTTVFDPTCSLIGLVLSQSPGAWARVLPGAPVTFGVGERDPSRECV